MKTTMILLLTILAVSTFTIVSSQTPQAFKYQTVVRNAAGDLTANQNVSFRFSIRNGSSGGPVIYQETHTALTNQFGLAMLNIGAGTPVSGVFSAIDWGSGSKFLEVELDPAGGSAYVAMGTSQLLSVPYALYSENTANVDDADADPANELQTISKVGNTVTLSDGGGAFTDETEDADPDPANELQTLSVDGNELSISDGNTVTLPSSGSGNRISDIDGDTYIDTELNNDNDSIVFTTFGMERMVISNNGYVEVNGQMIATGFQGDGSGLTGVPGDNLGNHTANEDLDMGNHRIANIVSPMNANDAATKLYVDTQISLGGDNLGDHTATQNIALNGFRISNDGENEGIAMDNDGNVGINTLAPDQRLTVDGNIRSEGQVMADYGAADNPTFRFGTGYENSGLASPYVNSVSVITNGLERLTVRQNGNVGIGEPNPQSPLHIIGNIRMEDGNQGPGKVLTSDANGIAAWSDPPSGGGSEGWIVAGNNVYTSVIGNVGIGTSTPDAKLDVAGRIIQTNTGRSVFIGEGAGENDDLTLNNNVFAGYNAGNTNTSGTYNLAAGSYSLNDNTSGNYNVALGPWAMHDNTTANSNVAIGQRAMYMNTTRGNIVAIGDSALYRNGVGATQPYHGTQNTAVGSKALSINATGYDNTAAGFHALKTNTSGYRNTAVGRDALLNNTTGYQNTAMGTSTLSANTSGYINTAVGMSSMAANTTGSANASIGHYSLYNNTTGERNTAPGHDSAE